MVVQALIARRLGPGPFGAIYFATAALGVWYLFVEWGGHAQVAAEVARDRRAGARLFASGMLLRVVFAVGRAAGHSCRSAAGCGYDEAVRLALSLVSMKLALQGLGALCLAVVRGYEKVHWQAGSAVFGNLTEAALVVTTLLARRRPAGSAAWRRSSAAGDDARRAGRHGRTAPPRHVAVPTGARPGASCSGGFSFLILDVVVRLQPFVDATFLGPVGAGRGARLARRGQPHFRRADLPGAHAELRALPDARPPVDERPADLRQPGAPGPADGGDARHPRRHRHGALRAVGGRAGSTATRTMRRRRRASA